MHPFSALSYFTFIPSHLGPSFDQRLVVLAKEDDLTPSALLTGAQVAGKGWRKTATRDS